jgi:membrane protease YdiL (CAAX protease family)
VSPVFALLWTAICQGAFEVLAALLAWLRGGPLDVVGLGAAEVLAYTVCTLSLLYVHERGASLSTGLGLRSSLGLRNSLGLRPTHMGLGLVGAGLGFALQVPAEALTVRIEKVFPPSDAELIARARLYDTSGLGKVAGLLAVVCLCAPLVEELFFRGALYGRLAKKLTPAWAGALSGFAFVVVHMDPKRWPALLVVALIASYLRIVSGSLLPCIGLHVAFNALGVLTLVSGLASPTRPLDVSPLLLGASWLGAALLIALLVKLADNPDVVRARTEDRA